MRPTLSIAPVPLDHVHRVPTTGDDPEEAGNEDLLAQIADAKIPPIDSLVPDAAYFAAVAKEPIHGGQLDGLSKYYA